MLTILKVTSGVSMEGVEHSMFVATPNGEIYDIAIDEITYSQIMTLIGGNLPVETPEEEQGGEKLALGVEESKPPESLDQGQEPDPSQRIVSLEHFVEGEEDNRANSSDILPPTPSEMLGKVGFDLDYTSALEDLEEDDPGESNLMEEEGYVRPL